MRFRPTLLFLVASLVFANPASAQTPPRDARAVAVLQQSFAAMGGTVPADSVATGRIRVTAGSKTEDGTIRILTRGLNQTGEHIDTEEGKRAVIYAHDRAAEVGDNGSVQKLWME